MFTSKYERVKYLLLLTPTVALILVLAGCQQAPPPQAPAKGWHLNLLLLKDKLAVCRLAPGEKVPTWAMSGGEFTSVTRTADELSVVCPEGAAPKGTKCESGWRIFKIEGPLDFALTGVLVAIGKPLADAGVSIFAVSTYDTDYVMIKEQNVEKAVCALTAAGHNVKRQ